jgi:DNA (cytosine-5)-methyltransferase 1
MIRTFEMFSGLGGSSRGAAAAGAAIAGGIDAWPLATEVFADNFPAAQVITSAVEDQDPARVLEATGPIELLLASPECTNHSCARGARPRSDESRDTAFEVVRYARAMQPRWIVIENVIHMRPWSRYAELLHALRGAGYRIAEHVVDAADHGVRQRRKRLFLLCDRDAEPPARIPKMRGPKPAATGILDRPGTWRRSLLDNGRRAAATLARAERAVAALGRDEPFLIVYYGNDGAGGWQPLTVPLRTVTTLDRFGLCEPSDDGLMLRMLQVPELARAMGFKDDLILNRGSRRERIMLLGNGVCPPVMEAVVTALVGIGHLNSNAAPSEVGSPGPPSGNEGSDSQVPLRRVA